MPSYAPPTKDMMFVLQNVLDVKNCDIPGYEDLDAEFVTSVLNESGKLAKNVLAPLNASGDAEGCHLEKGSKTPLSKSRLVDGRAWIAIPHMAAKACRL